MSGKKRRKSYIEDAVHEEQTVNDIAAENEKDGVGENLMANISFTDRVFYEIENRIASNPSTPFVLLSYAFCCMMVVFAILWYACSTGTAAEDNGLFGTESWKDAFFMSAQLLLSAGYDDSIPDINGLRVLYFAVIFFGLVIFSVLVGFITDKVNHFMSSLEGGRTKVVEENHTLILGWNEATLRVVVQTSFLRRQYQILNEDKFFFYVRNEYTQTTITAIVNVLKPYLLAMGLFEIPSTSMAANDIVIMTNTKTKEEMHDALAMTMAERGINPARTKIGQNIICRVGDPTNVNDLFRVGAHKAAAILVMLTDQDNEEEDYSDGRIKNGATLRCTLAIRHVIFSPPKFSASDEINPDLRVLLQMTSPCAYVDAACFKGANKNDVIMPMDLSVFLNSLMFSCASQPGLAKVILSILDFEGSSIRRRKSQNLRSGPKNELGCCIGKTFGEMRKQFVTAIFIGIIRPDGITDKEKIRKAGLGLCPDVNTVIRKDDLLIFIGPKSNPVCSPTMVDQMDEYRDTATKYIEQYKPSGVAEVKDLKNVIICGWRPVWEESPERLHKRIMEICSLRLPGSRMIFINFVEPEKFTEIMKIIGFTVKRDTSASGDSQLYALPAPYQGIFIEHILGDAAEAEMLEPIVLNNTIHTAIVLGTQATVRLNANSRDTRVLSIMLLLRKIWNVKNEGVFMHIVGENQQDMTARLALAPRTSNIGKGVKAGGHDPDFINTQAIYARAMVQTLAYPLIAPAVEDLFDDTPGSCDCSIVRSTVYVPEGIDLPYGVVRASVLQAKGERSICIGIIDSTGKVIMMPPHDFTMVFTNDDKLVLLRRILIDEIEEKEKKEETEEKEGKEENGDKIFKDSKH